MTEPSKETIDDRVGIETRNVFLDTEVYRSENHRLDTKLMKVLGQYVLDGILALHTTDVTLREISRQLADMERGLAKRANKVAQELSDWNRRYRHHRHRLAVPDRLCRPAEPTNAYRDFERTLRRNWQAKEHESSSLSIGPILDRYFSRRAPFDMQGSKEFPDAIALLVLEKWCDSTQERIYVVSKDKAVLRTASESPHLIEVHSLDRLLSLVGSAQDHDMAEVVSSAFRESQLLNEFRDSLSANIGSLEWLYEGYRLDVEIIAMDIPQLEEVEDVTILRVDQDQVACVAQVKLVVFAEIQYTDVTFAIWDREDRRYYGAQLAVADVQDSVTLKTLVELKRKRDEIALLSTQFLSQNLTFTDLDD